MTPEKISISKHRDSIYEFEASIEGITPKRVQFRLVIEDGKQQVMYKCLQKDEKRWYVTIPSNNHISGPRHPFKIESIVDGYYFGETLVGVVEVHEQDIGVSVTPTQQTTAYVPEPKRVEPEEITVPEPEPEETQPVKVDPVHEPEATVVPVPEPEKKDTRGALDIANDIINKTNKHKRNSEVNKKIADALASMKKVEDEKKRLKQDELDRIQASKDEAEQIAQRIRQEKEKKAKDAVNSILGR